MASYDQVSNKYWGPDLVLRCCINLKYHTIYIYIYKHLLTIMGHAGLSELIVLFENNKFSHYWAQLFIRKKNLRFHTNTI